MTFPVEQVWKVQDLAHGADCWQTFKKHAGNIIKHQIVNSIVSVPHSYVQLVYVILILGKARRLNFMD